MLKSVLNLRNTFLNLPRMASSTTSKCTVSVVQFTATEDKESNFNIVRKLVEQSASQNAKMVFLPEAADFIARDQKESRDLSEPITGPLMTSYRDLAKELGVWLSVGGFHEKVNEDTVYNSHVIITDQGEIREIYRKIHLFDVTLPDQNVNLRESDNTVGGSRIVGPLLSPAGALGLCICYDLRFPEQSTLLRKLGAEVLTYPSAFTANTGRAHWEILLRARAVENQCYVIAAAQYGKHNEKRTSFGQSMIVDPWGRIVAECPKYVDDASAATNQSVATAILDLDLVRKIRAEMPVFAHRRNDLYTLNRVESAQEIEDSRIYRFADKEIPGKTVFFVSRYCFAFTNIRCVVPGHVLVSTLRPAKRLQDLSAEEMADLLQTTVKVSRAVEVVRKAQSSTVCVQDGPFAGQTVPHVHVHVLPRKRDDFAHNDDVYTHLAKHDRDDGSPIRSREEQIEEAAVLRKYFY